MLVGFPVAPVFGQPLQVGLSLTASPANGGGSGFSLRHSAPVRRSRISATAPGQEGRLDRQSIGRRCPIISHIPLPGVASKFYENSVGQCVFVFHKQRT